jgi:hypothetical protein
MLRNGRMWPLLISGLLCVPALVALFFGWPHDGGVHVEDFAIAPVQMVTTASPSAITISLPPGWLQTEPPQTDLAWDDSFTTAAMPPEPIQPSPKRVRTLHARAPTPRPSSSVVVAQTEFQQQPDAVWARVAHWLTRHEAPKIWSPGGGQGAG